MRDSQNDAETNDSTDARSGAETPAGKPTTDRWLGADDVLGTRLPADLREALGRFIGKDSIDTLGELTAEFRRLTDGESIAVGDLCHASAETDHWGEVGGERYHFRCFYDAVVLAALEERPVDIHTVSPDGVVIEARAVGSNELSVTPATAVFSFGIAEDAGERSGGDPTLEESYAAICPFVRAFPSREAYEAWADGAPAATVGLALAGATDVAEALVG